MRSTRVGLRARPHRSNPHSRWTSLSRPQGLATVLKVEVGNALVFFERSRGCLPPGSIGLEHGVEDHNDPAHHCYQRDFFALAACAQSFMKLLEHRIAADRTKRAHVKLAADRIASTSDDPATGMC